MDASIRILMVCKIFCRINVTYIFYYIAGRFIRNGINGIKSYIFIFESRHACNSYHTLIISSLVLDSFGIFHFKD